MKIDEIIVEDFDYAKAFVNGNQIDPQLLKAKKNACQRKDGIDPDADEVIQDLPI